MAGPIIAIVVGILLATQVGKYVGQNDNWEQLKQFPHNNHVSVDEPNHQK